MNTINNKQWTKVESQLVFKFKLKNPVALATSLRYQIGMYHKIRLYFRLVKVVISIY